MTDIVIVGGGVMGCAVACHLKLADPGLKVTVVERDASYRTASSALSASSIRQQFSTPLNIAMSRYGIDFLRDAGRRLAVDADRPDITLVERGYLTLATPAGYEALTRAHGLQTAAGADLALLRRDGLARHFPWLATDDLAGGVLGRRDEGWFDGYSLLQAFRRKALALGVAWHAGIVTGFAMTGSAITGVTTGDGGVIACDTVVNAAGPQAAAIAAMAGIDLPVRPEKRSIFVVDCKAAPADCPLVIDPCGIYFRPEGRHFIVGAPSQGLGDDGFEVDHHLFDDMVWPALAARVPAFETLKLISAWAGHYETNAFDHNALIGTDPGCANLYFINGFSGHGMQHAPAAGRGLAELILHGAYRSLDLSPLGLDRLRTNRPIVELQVI